VPFFRVVGEFLIVVGCIDGHRDEIDAFVGELIIQAGEQRDVFFTGPAPGGESRVDAQLRIPTRIGIGRRWLHSRRFSHKGGGMSGTL
jgi:hypothetical protein